MSTSPLSQPALLYEVSHILARNSSSSSSGSLSVKPRGSISHVVTETAESLSWRRRRAPRPAAAVVPAVVPAVVRPFHHDIYLCRRRTSIDNDKAKEPDDIPAFDIVQQHLRDHILRTFTLH